MSFQTATNSHHLFKGICEKEVKLYSEKIIRRNNDFSLSIHLMKKKTVKEKTEGQKTHVNWQT